MGNADMSSFLEINNISKAYSGSENDRFLVLKNLSFDVKQNEFLTIVGPSGCGKTTLLKLIAGFIKTDSGQILKKNKILNGSAPDRIMLFQDFEQLFPWKTVLENVLFPLRAKNILATKNERVTLAKKYLKDVYLENYLDFYPHQLSGGMKQRVALARALVIEPAILLMDEPFGSLDGQSRNYLQDMLLEIWKNYNRTIIFVTHDIREAIKLGDRIIVMENEPGRLKKIIVNKIKRPRQQVDQEFIELYNQIYALLK